MIRDHDCAPMTRVRLTRLASRTITLAFVAMGCTRSPSTSTGSRPSVVVLVRHGEKATSAGDDPSLSDAGHARAAALADALGDAHVTHVITTQFRRTQETAAPLAERLGLRPTVIPIDLSDIRRYVAAVSDSVRRSGGVTLIVGHQNTVPAVIRALGGPATPEICAEDYGDLYILVLGVRPGPSLMHETFGVPHPAHSATCAAAPTTPH